MGFITLDETLILGKGKITIFFFWKGGFLGPPFPILGRRMWRIFTLNVWIPQVHAGVVSVVKP